jgi:ABC-2 type transport system permease protein
MRAVYKKEMRSYFHSVAAYIFLALFLAASGIYFSVICMGYGYTDYAAYIYSNITILYIVIVPILTMRLMAEEKKQKTDQLLLTSPVRVSGIVVGKYLAVLTLLLGTVIISVCQAAVLSLYGTVNWKTVLTGSLGYFLLGACLLAIGLFISALTENQVISAALSFGVVLLCMLLPNISSQLPERARYAYVVCGLAALLLGWFFWKETKNIVAGVAATVVSGAVVGILAYAKADLFDNGLSKIVDWFSVVDRFYDFCSGVLNASSIIYYISFSAVFVYLTIWVTEKRRWS